ncbi:MAG: 1-acyl-sn-glycerol-3-phosphate acyltransferase [Microthrixaceae bacterium]
MAVRIRAWLSRLALSLWRWKAVGRPPSVGSVIVCAPHTSNVDYLLMIFVAWSNGMTLSWLGKEELFKPPVLGPLLRATGGIAVDRSAPSGLVGQMADEFRRNPGLMLAIPPEGTRSRTEHWKSGFYRIAERAGVPISLAFIDKSRRRVGFGIELTPSGDIDADMALIAEFYDGKVGLKHENFGPVRLKPAEPPEDGAAAAHP